MREVWYHQGPSGPVYTIFVDGIARFFVRYTNGVGTCDKCGLGCSHIIEAEDYRKATAREFLVEHGIAVKPE